MLGSLAALRDVSRNTVRLSFSDFAQNHVYSISSWVIRSAGILIGSQVTYFIGDP